jgi:hypothetical protein
VPEHLHGVDRDVWIIEQEIAAVRTSLAQARREGSTRTAALTKELRELLAEARELRPPPPPDPGEEERRWRAEAEAVVRMVEAGVRAAERRARA